MSESEDRLAEWQGSSVLLSKWHERARINQFQHYEAAKYYAMAHKRIGIPAAIVAGIVGSAVFASLQKEVDIRIKVAVAALSLLAAVLTTLQTFLKYGETAEKHRNAAAAYAGIRHRIEAAANVPIGLRPPLKELLSGVETQVDSLAQSAPDIPDRIWQRVRSEKKLPRLSIGAELPPSLSANSESKHA